MRSAVLPLIVFLLGGCASPQVAFERETEHQMKLCCAGFDEDTTPFPPLGLASQVPIIREVVRRERKDGFVGQIRWMSRYQALVCVSDGCVVVHRSYDGTWFTGEHIEKPHRPKYEPQHVPSGERVIITG